MKNTNSRRTAHQLYGSIVTQARSKEFYTRFGVQDSVEGRFELITLHHFIVLNVLKKHGEQGQELASGLIDRYFEDIDDNLREMGIGDTSVPKKMHKFADAFYGRITAYEKAVSNNDHPALSAAIARNVFNSEFSSLDQRRRDQITSLAHYVEDYIEDLTDKPLTEPTEARHRTETDPGGNSGNHVMTDNVDQAAAPIFDRMITVDDIPEHGLEVSIDANDEERKKLASALDVSNIEQLKANLSLRRKAQNRVAVQGKYRATVIQACVVTLDPIMTKFSETLDAEYWPEEQIGELLGAEALSDDALDLEPLAADGPDPIVKGQINLGQLLYENLATQIDPFPRKDDAEFDWKDKRTGSEDLDDDPAINPFAVLKKLKES